MFPAVVDVIAGIVVVCGLVFLLGVSLMGTPTGIKQPRKRA